MRNLSEIFWRHSWDVCTQVPNNSEFLVCLSVCQLAYFLTEIRQIQDYLQFWIRYLSENFWGHSWDVDTLFPKKLYFLFVCQFVSWLTALLKLRQMLDFLQFWMRCLSNFFRHSWDVGSPVPNTPEFLVCLSVSLLPQ